MARIDPKFMLRLPPDLKERVQYAAAKGNQSMNAVILSALEEAFPHPAISAHDIAAMLTSLAREAETGELEQDWSYFEETNKALAGTKTPWRVAYKDGAIVFERAETEGS